MSGSDWDGLVHVLSAFNTLWAQTCVTGNDIISQLRQKQKQERIQSANRKQWIPSQRIGTIERKAITCDDVIRFYR